MGDFIIKPPADFQSLFDQHDDDIYIDINTNPGTTLGDIVTRTGKQQVIVETIIEVMHDSGIIAQRPDVSGIARYYTAESWASAVRTNVSAARTWVDNPANDGRLASEMAVDISVDEAVALQLARVLQFEAKARIKPI